ncbi:MAG: hypothetical protein Q8938_19250, partial [Bacteroidota bacterium]|nr:hypothetical protein [Bacteroidota bacterium]
SLTGKPIYAVKKFGDTVLDISTIEIDRQQTFPFEYLEVSPGTAGPVRIGSSIAYCGFPIIGQAQVNSSQYFEGRVTDSRSNRKEFTMAIVGYTGCSGSPIFDIGESTPRLCGVNSYAKKDGVGRADSCRAVDIIHLFDLFQVTPAYNHRNFSKPF